MIKLDKITILQLNLNIRSQLILEDKITLVINLHKWNIKLIILMKFLKNNKKCCLILFLLLFRTLIFYF